MREISSDELKKIQLDMLIDVARFCEENNINYFLSSGTLLGAIRHKGFIPWDDDIDIMMPRKDYKNFVSKYSHEYYVAKDISTCKKFYEKHCKVCDTRTVLNNFVRKLGLAEEHIFIDIFPIDGVPNNKMLQRLLVYATQFIVAMHSATVLSYSVTNRYNDCDAGFLNWRKYLRTAIKFFLIATVGHANPRFLVRQLHKLLQLWKYDDCDFVGSLVTGAYGAKEIMSKHIFKHKHYTLFEEYDFCIPGGYEEYLRSLYGKYMELPPMEKRKSHHDFIAYWK